jgi:hypothetical protein
MQELKEHFQQEGYITLEGILPDETVDGCKAACGQLVDSLANTLLATGKIANDFRELPLETRLISLYQDYPDEAPKLFRPELHLEPFYDLFFCPALLDLVEVILGPEIRLYPNYTVRPKTPQNKRAEVLWHQDGAYTEELVVNGADGDVDRLRMVNVWTPLVPVNVENGCMQFIPETHKLGVVGHSQKEHYLEIDPEHLDPWLDAGKVVDITLNPGDVVLFNDLLFHQGLPNTSSGIRWSVDFRYQDATQSTLLDHQGHIARSRSQPGLEVKSRQQWASLSFT